MVVLKQLGHNLLYTKINYEGWTLCFAESGENIHGSAVSVIELGNVFYDGTTMVEIRSNTLSSGYNPKNYVQEQII